MKRERETSRRQRVRLNANRLSQRLQHTCGMVGQSKHFVPCNRSTRGGCEITRRQKVKDECPHGMKAAQSWMACPLAQFEPDAKTQSNRAVRCLAIDQSSADSKNRVHGSPSAWISCPRHLHNLFLYPGKGPAQTGRLLTFRTP